MRLLRFFFTKFKQFVFRYPKSTGISTLLLILLFSYYWNEVAGWLLVIMTSSISIWILIIAIIVIYSGINNIRSTMNVLNVGVLNQNFLDRLREEVIYTWMNTCVIIALILGQLKKTLKLMKGINVLSLRPKPSAKCKPH